MEALAKMRDIESANFRLQEECQRLKDLMTVQDSFTIGVRLEVQNEKRIVGEKIKAISELKSEVEEKDEEISLIKKTLEDLEIKLKTADRIHVKTQKQTHDI